MNNAVLSFDLLYNPYDTIKDHLTVPCLVVRPLNINEAGIDFDTMQILLLYVK